MINLSRISLRNNGIAVPNCKGWTCLFLILFSFSSIGALAQGGKTISLSLKNESLKQAITAIETQTDYAFMYNNKLIDVEQQVSINIKNKAVTQVLPQLFKGTNITYSVVDRQIVLKSGTAPRQQASVKNVSGTVKSVTGEGLPGVTVMVAGTTRGTVTDYEGNFKLSEVASSEVLVFTFIGLEEQRIKVGNQSIMSVIMKEDVLELEEFVAIGYGYVEKSSMTGAVSSVKAEDIETSTLPSIGHMLQGKAAGLNITTNSAQPGGGLNFNIRGLGSTGIGNQPLVVIDGYPISNDGNDPNAGGLYGSGSKSSVLNSINPEDIESIEILKDASATAIYGARAANGVVLIQTKRGKAGKAELQYSNNFAVQILANKPKMLDGPDYMRQVNRVMKEQWMFDNKLFPYGSRMNSEAAPYVPRFSQHDIDNAITTDWYDEITRPGTVMQHNISLKAGTEKTKVLFSTNYYNNEGVVKNNNFERITGRLNVDHTFNDFVKAGTSVMLTRINNNNFSASNSSEAHDSGIIGNALGFPSVLPIYDANGDYQQNTFNTQMPNPVSMLEIRNQSSNDRILVNNFVEVEPIERFTIKGTLGFDRQIGRGRSYLPKTTLAGARSGGRADQSLNDQFNYQFDLVGSYNTTFLNKNKITVMGGHSFQRFKTEGFSAGNAKFLNDYFGWNNLGQGELERPSVGSWANTSTMASFFFRAMYDYDSRYLLTATMRADGSSDFAENNKWGYFPSVALAWRLDQEEFFKNVDKISNLKLRVSYGQTGNAGLGGNAISYFSNSWTPYVFGGVVNNGMRLQQLANPDLKWETTTELNLGVDFGMFNGRVTVAAEYYQRQVSDLLSYRTLPSYLEVNTVAANIGKTQTNGWELTLNTVNIDTKDFSWNTTFTASHYFDRWKERDPNWVAKPWERYDGALRQDAGYLSDGLVAIGEKVPHMPNAQPGQVKIKDLDGFQRDESGQVIYDPNTGRPLRTGQPDGFLDEADYVIYNEDRPYFLGFNNMFRYKTWDLSINTYAVMNRMGWNRQSHYTTTAATVSGQNVLEITKDTWAHDNTNGSIPSVIGSEYPWGDFTYVDMSFLRVANISLGYEIPVTSLPKGISRLRVFTTVTNPFLFTNYPGQDPETDYSFAAYPNSRSYSAGLNVTF